MKLIRNERQPRSTGSHLSGYAFVHEDDERFTLQIELGDDHAITLDNLEGWDRAE
jgi:hypothetical protein